MRSIVEDSASYSQEATSPQKREALLKVRAMEDVLVEETKGRPMAVSGVRDDDDREFWREDVRVVPYVLAETQESAGMWEATILLAIRGEYSPRVVAWIELMRRYLSCSRRSFVVPVSYHPLFSPARTRNCSLSFPRRAISPLPRYVPNLPMSCTLLTI